MSSSLALLKSELGNLVVQSKKRNADIRRTSEESLAQIEALNSPADEQAAVRSLANIPQIITPFILACSAGNAKSCASSLQCLQVLVVGQGIAPERLGELLDSLTDATQLGIGIQLKILQILPLLFQEYAQYIYDNLVVKLIQVCAELHGNNKVAMVHNAAYATLQQIITSLFDRVQNDTGSNSNNLNVGENLSFMVSPAVYDAAMVLIDLCNLASKKPPEFLTIKDLPVTFTLELLELTLTNNATVFHKCEVFSTILRKRVLELLLDVFSDASDFPTILRRTRIFYLLLRRHLNVIADKTKTFIFILTQMATGSPLWKQALGIEALQGIVFDLDLVLAIFRKFDIGDGHAYLIRSIFDSFAAILVQSDHLSLNADTDSPGNVTENSSSLRIPIIDMLDKTEAPKIPNRYLYNQIMISINNFADSFNRHTLKHEDDNDDTMHNILTQCAPSVTNCLTVFIGSAMDLEMYKSVIRSTQRFAHAAGVLGLDSIRDSYIRLLIQYSYVPSDEKHREKFITRHVLCLRALFNLAYALGNQLGNSWSLIIQAIEEFHRNMGLSYPTLECIFVSEDPNIKSVELTLRKLLDNLQNLSISAVISIFIALGKSSSNVALVLLHYLALGNAPRLADMTNGCWNTCVPILLKVMKDQGIDDDLRMRASFALNSITFEVAGQVLSGEGYSALIKSIETQLSELNSYVDETSHDMQIQAIKCLNRILDQYGSRLTSGWENIFALISSVLTRTQYKDHAQKVRDVIVIQESFHTLELVCTDFLETVPYCSIYSLIICLDQFSRQKLDINTSFTATSLFWTVCNFVMSSEKVLSDFPTIRSEEDLYELSQNPGSEHNHTALWIFAESKLAGIATEPQHQTRIGALSILFRLIEAHGDRLCSGAWATCHALVFPRVMDILVESDADERDETLKLIVQSLGSVYVKHFSEFMHLDGFVQVFNRFITYLAYAAKQSANVSVVAYQVVDDLLEKIVRCKFINEVWDCLWSFWIGQISEIDYEDLNPRVLCDALVYLLKLFPKLTEVHALETKQIVLVFQHLEECLRFPNPGSYGKLGELTPLQAQGLALLKRFSLENSETTAALMSCLSALSVLPYSEDSKVCEPNNLYNQLSREALQFLSDQLKQYTASIDSTFQYLTKVVDNMTVVLRKGERHLAPKIFLMLLEMATSHGQFSEIGSHVVDVVRIAVDKKAYQLGTEDQDISLVDEIIEILNHDPQVDADIWTSIISSIMKASLIYERGRFNEAYLEQEKFREDNLRDNFYGSVEQYRKLPRIQIGFHCLELLAKLAQGESFQSKLAKHYHICRAEMALYQYVSDAQLRGREPMGDLVRRELLQLLTQLQTKEYRSELNDMFIRCIHIRDDEISILIESILSPVKVF